MTIFLIWTSIFLTALSAVFFYLMKSKRTGLKFRTRISIWFLLMALLPAVPLILLSVGVINESLELFVPGGMADLLDESNEVIRKQLAEKSDAEFEKFAHLRSSSFLNKIAESETKFDYIYVLSTVEDSVKVDTLKANGANESLQRVLDITLFNDVLSGDQTAYLDAYLGYFESYTLTSDSRIIAAGLKLDNDVLSTIRNIQNQSTSYGLLLMSKSNIVAESWMYIFGLVMMFVISVAALIGGARVSKGITQPIQNLVSGFEKVGDGNMETAVAPEGKDELLYLIESFNSMVTDLKDTQVKLLQSERIAAWKDVARQISHEIKNPLTPIQLSLHRIKNKIVIPPESAEAVNECFVTIEEEIESLRKIAAEFSEFARMPKANPIKTDIIQIIKSTVSLYKDNDRKIEISAYFTVDAEDLLLDSEQKNTETLELMLDPEQMKRVFINLITNGIDATPVNGGGMKILVAAKNSRVFITFRDKGDGIKPDDLRHIFDPYFTTKSHGTGLGLPIIRRIIEDHNGDIKIDSVVGEGTTIVISLPIAQ